MCEAIVFPLGFLPCLQTRSIQNFVPMTLFSSGALNRPGPPRPHPNILPVCSLPRRRQKSQTGALDRSLAESIPPPARHHCATIIVPSPGVVLSSPSSIT